MDHSFLSYFMIAYNLWLVLCLQVDNAKAAVESLHATHIQQSTEYVNLRREHIALQEVVASLGLSAEQRSCVELPVRCEEYNFNPNRRSIPELDLRYAELQVRERTLHNDLICAQAEIARLGIELTKLTAQIHSSSILLAAADERAQLAEASEVKARSVAKKSHEDRRVESKRWAEQMLRAGAVLDNFNIERSFERRHFPN